jgi:prepilin-type N-terminal cleavage/methylation domain-containing protein
MMIKIIKRQDGFSLVEIIVTFVLIAVMAVFLTTIYSRTYTDNAKLLSNLKKSLDLKTSMENMVADYNANYTSNLVDLKTNIEANNYGTYTIVYCGYIQFDLSGGNYVEAVDSSAPYSALKVSIKNDLNETITTVFNQ